MGHAFAKARVLAEIDQLIADVGNWTWGAGDPRASCTAHAKALRNTITSAAEKLRETAGRIAQPDIGDRLRALRDVERELGVIRAVADELRRRIDARVPQPTAAVLKAADEIVWSTHRAAMNNAKPGGEPLVPLVSIGPEWGAEMVPVARVDLRSNGSVAQAASQVLKTLAIRDIRLPWAVVNEPWLLSLLLHEVGHAIEFDLVPDGGLLPAFAQHLGDLVGGKYHDEWRAWAHEVFADACAVAAGGSAILPVLVAWETTATNKLISSSARSQRYPPPVVRWELVRRWSERLGMPPGDPPGILAGLSFDAGLGELLQDVPKVLDALEKPLPLLGDLTIAKLWPDTPALVAGALAQKQADLKGKVFADASMPGARLALLASVLAADAGGQAPTDYAVWRQDLCERSLALMGACHGPGTRAAGDAPDHSVAADLLGTLASDAMRQADGEFTLTQEN